LATYPGEQIPDGTVFAGRFANPANYSIQPEQTTNRTKSVGQAKGVAETPSTNRTNSGRMVFYRSIAEVYGGIYNSSAGGNNIIYIDDITYPEYGPVGHNSELAKRQTYDYNWMQANLYWDWWGNWYAASWETNTYTLQTEYYGWNSYLGYISFVYSPTCVDTVGDGNGNAIISSSPCGVVAENNGFQENTWCNPVGYTPGTVVAYVYMCDL
jgi:hypothetical protein